VSYPDLYPDTYPGDAAAVSAAAGCAAGMGTAPRPRVAGMPATAAAQYARGAGTAPAPAVTSGPVTAAAGAASGTGTAPAAAGAGASARATAGAPAGTGAAYRAGVRGLPWTALAGPAAGTGTAPQPTIYTAVEVLGTMADSLTIAGIIELLGGPGGVPSTLPQCPGAVFRLLPGYDMGSPQPTVDVTGSLLLDGERPYGRRASNRQITLPILIRGATQDAAGFSNLAAAREVLMQAIDAQTWQLAWSRDGGPGPLILECFRGLPSVVEWGGFWNLYPISKITVSFPALPYAHSDVPVTLQFASPASGYIAPPSPVTLDAYSSSGGWASGWSRSSTHVIGPYSAHWDESATAGGEVEYPVLTRSFTAADISAQSSLSVWAGLAAAKQVTHSTTFKIVLTDAGSRHLTIGVTKKCTASNSSSAPFWQLITAPIPPPGTFDLTQVTGYTLSAWAQTGDLLADHLFLDYLQAVPTTGAVIPSTRGTVYTLLGVQGSARAPLSLIIQQPAVTPFRAFIAHRPSADAPDLLSPMVDVGDGSDTPNGGTEYAVPQPVTGLNARFEGTYTVVLASSTISTPTVTRNVKVTVTQYEYAGGPAATAIVGGSSGVNIVPTGTVSNNLWILGEITLPIKDIPDENTAAYYTVKITDTNTADRFMDCLFLDVQGQTAIVGAIPGGTLDSGSGYPIYYLDEPTSDYDLGKCLASSTGRPQAVSVTDSAILTGGPLTADPGDNPLLVYSPAGQPSLTCTYLPRWMADRPY
jgi:hypothetical protein